jgi:hypothetical protein
MSNEIFNIFDAVFFISIGSLVIGFFGLIIKYCLKSKCEHFSLCWGLITIDRRVDIEAQEEMARIEHGLPEDDIPATSTNQQPQTHTTRRPSHTGDESILPSINRV